MGIDSADSAATRVARRSAERLVRVFHAAVASHDDDEIARLFAGRREQAEPLVRLLGETLFHAKPHEDQADSCDERAGGRDVAHRVDRFAERHEVTEAVSDDRHAEQCDEQQRGRRLRQGTGRAEPHRRARLRRAGRRPGRGKERNHPADISRRSGAVAAGDRHHRQPDQDHEREPHPGRHPLIHACPRARPGRPRGL